MDVESASLEYDQWMAEFLGAKQQYLKSNLKVPHTAAIDGVVRTP